MSSGQRFAGYPATFKDSAPTTVNFAQMSAWELQSNNTIATRRPMGSIDPLQYTVSRSRPRFTLRTPDLSTLLANVGFTSGKLWDGESDFRLAERVDGDGFLTGGTHPARRTTNGFMYIDTIRASQEDAQGAMADLVYVPLYDGTNDPVQLVTAEDHSTAPAVAYTSGYYLSCPYIDGSAVPGVQDVTLSPGITYQPSPSSCGAFDELGSITMREPQMSMRCLKVDEFDTTTLTGIPVGTSVAFYFQKADPTNANGDGRIAPATASHFKLSFTTGHIEVTSLSVDGVEDAIVQVTFRPLGTITVSTASAIP